jgi:hypothetical protein
MGLLLVKELLNCTDKSLKTKKERSNWNLKFNNDTIELSLQFESNCVQLQLVHHCNYTISMAEIKSSIYN